VTFKELLFKFNTFVEEKGYVTKKSVGLISPIFPHEFNVSGGHEYAMEIFKTIKPIASSLRYSLIDTSFRRMDMEHIGFSDRHISLFHMAVFACGVMREKINAYINELVFDFTQLLTERLEILKDELLFTTFDGGQILNFNLKREDCLIESLRKAMISESKILPLEGRRNFFLAQNIECSGPSCEVYFDRGKEFEYGSRFIEIGSMNFYKYRYNARNGLLELSPNQIFVCGIGIERTLMAKQGKPSVFDIDVLAPLVEIVSRYFSNSVECSIFINSVRTIVDCVKSAIFILSEGVKPDNSSRGRILRKIIKNLTNQMKYLNLSKSNILDELQDKVTEIYGDLYPKIKQQKIDLKVLISNKFKEEVS